MSEYIPYSTRHNINDPDLAWILDYLERDMGWDIELKIKDKNFWIRDSRKKLLIYKGRTSISFEIKEKEGVLNYSNNNILTMEIPLLLRTYKTLLPVIRDLYNN